MRRHIVFVTPPTPGHVFPTLPLAEELIARGHRVSYVVGDDLAATVQAAGAAVLGLDWTPDDVDESQADFTFETLMTALTVYLDAAESSLPRIVSALRLDAPDLICCDSVPLGQLLAAMFDVPMVSLQPTFATNEHFTADRLVPGVDPAHSAFGSVMARMGSLFATYQVPAPSGPPPGPTLVFIPKEFQIAGDTFDESFHFIGPSAERRPGADDWQPADAGRLLLVSLGTAFNNRPDFFAAAAAAFAGTDWHVVMAVGKHTDQAKIGPVPPNVQLAADVPQLAVLRHASAFVTHAGMGSTMEALYHRVPVVAVPQVSEQAVIAGRVQELGLGHDMGVGTPSAQQLREAVERVASEEAVRARLDEMRATIDDAGGAKRGADVLERMLA
ncbi:MAG TPA: macrolide family glycosyltransferase [Mycobacterium sp.]|nr:macrolide family glycosyltransferase [Mycobacterium sp.]